MVAEEAEVTLEVSVVVAFREVEEAALVAVAAAEAHPGVVAGLAVAVVADEVGVASAGEANLAMTLGSGVIRLCLGYLAFTGCPGLTHKLKVKTCRLENTLVRFSYKYMCIYLIKVL